MEPLKEHSEIADNVLDIINSELPELNARLLPAGDSEVLVCDYTPIPIPWDQKEPHTEDETTYKHFLDVVKDLKNANNIAGVDQISMRGYVDIRDCFRIVSRGENREKIFVIPSSEYEKIRESGIHPKTEKMEQYTERWWAQNKDKKMPDRSLQLQATESLLGLEYDYLIPVISGLKPVALDMEVKPLTLSAARAVSQNLAVLDKPEHAIFNPQAVTRIAKDHAELFEKHGIKPNYPPKHIVIKALQLSYKRGGHHGKMPNDSDGNEITAIIGLLLGYDAHSCISHDRFHPDWVEGKDHPWVGAIAHQINEFPFNIWGVDYGVVDKEDNGDFAALKVKYDKLQIYIEGLLEGGLSPLQVMERLPSWKNPGSSPARIKEGLRAKLDFIIWSARNRPSGHHH